MNHSKLYFFDTFSLYRAQNVTFPMHRPVKDPGNPILVPEHAWEGWRSFPYGRSVLRDPRDGLYKMWYETMHDGEATGMGWERRGTKRMAYATSRDGVHWQRPSLGQMERDGSTNNSLIKMGPFGMHFGNFIIDDHDPDPERRFKSMFWAVAPKDGKTDLVASVQVAASPDGIHWNLLRDPSDPAFGPRPLTRAPGGNDYRFGHDGPYGKRTAGDAVSLLGWVERQGHYVAYLKSSDHAPDAFRTICYTESSDFINWSRLVSVLHPDENDFPGTEFYYMTVFPFGDVYIGLLSVYHNYSRRRGAWHDATAEVPTGHIAMDQHMDVRLAYSRDGQIWHQAGNRQAFISLGEGDAWDRGVIYGSTLLEVEDEIFVYYAGTPMRHLSDDLQFAGQIRDGQLQGIFGGLARLRKDGFVSVHAGAEGGEIITQPLAPSGGALRFNAKTGKTGEIVFQMLEENRSPLEGAKAVKFQGDAVRGKIDLAGALSPNAIDGRRLRLQVSLRDADLYTVSL